jgi:hypothetical protein
MRTMRTLAALILCAACGGSSPPPGPTPPPAAPPAPAAASAVHKDLGWLVGRWESPHGIEHWVAAGDALFGVSFTADGKYEALLIRTVNNAVVYDASPDGGPSTAFPLNRAAGQTVVFSALDHDPVAIAYSRNGDQLHAQVEFQGDVVPLKLDWTLAGPGSAPELEAADKAWSDAVAARGVDAWVEGFDPEGTQRTNGGQLITDAAERRKIMEPVLAGSFRLLWQPVASGWSPAKNMGYTVGTWRYLAGNDEKGRGAYLTIWRRQPDGSFKAYWDGGDPEG